MPGKILRLGEGKFYDFAYLVQEAACAGLKIIAAVNSPYDAAGIAFLPELQTLVECVSLSDGNTYQNVAEKLIKQIDDAARECLKA